MATDNLSLLFKLKAQNETSAAFKSVQNDVNKLRGVFGNDFTAIQSVATTSLGRITQSLTQVAAQTPVVGSAVAGLSTSINSLATNSAAATTGLSALAGGSVLAAAAAGALITGAIQAGKAAFDLAKQAGDAGGKIFDLSQKVNFSAETLSALQQAAKTSGSDIESLSASLGIFNKNMEKSASSTKETGDVFKQFKIDTNDNEKALRQVFQLLISLPSGAQQASLAMQFFGRSGKDVLGVLKEMGGDIDTSIAKYRELGLIITGDAARAADKFGDQLETLNQQFEGLTRQVGEQLIPLVLDVIQKLSLYLKDNREEILRWAKSAQDAAATAIEWRGEILILTTAMTPLFQAITIVRQGMETWNDIPGIIRRIITEMVPLLKLMELIKQAHDFLNPKGPGGFTGTPSDFFDAGGGETPQPLSGQGRSDRTPGVGRSGGGGGSKGKSAQDSVFRAALEASRQAAAAELEEQRTLGVALRQAYELNLVNLEDYYRQRQGLIDIGFNAEIDAINREQAALDEARARGRIKTEEANKKDAELTIRTTKAQNKLEEETNALRIEKQQRLDRAALEVNRQLIDIRNAQREGELGRIEDLLDRQLITESEAIRRRAAIEQAAHDDRVLLLNLELQQITTSAERKIAIDNELIASEQRRTDRQKELTQQRIDAMNRESAANAPGVGRRFEPESGQKNIGQIIEDQIGAPPKMLDVWKDAFKELQEIGSNAMQDLAFGVGDLVHQWVLLGTIGPNAVRKMAASVIAGVAAQAAVKAVFELAQGFAALFTNPAEAAAHFTSAAIFGSIAGVAAGAGRLIAGGAFQQAGGGGGTAGTGTRSTSTASGKPATFETDRRNVATPTQNLVLKIQPPNGWVGEEFRKDYLLNGVTRLTIVTDGGS